MTFNISVCIISLKMPRKKTLGPELNPSSSEFTKLSKLSQKKLGDSIGSMPDEWDEKNIEMALGRFEHENPGLINKMYNDLCVELALSGIGKHGELAEGFRKGFWLPSSPRKKGFDLQKWMEQAYPSFWRNEKHARWFMRHFPQFSFEYAAKRVKR